MANRRESSKAARREAARQELLRAQAAARRRTMLTVGGVVLAVAVLAAIVVVIGLHSRAKSGPASTVATTNVVKDVTHVPQATFDKVGTGGVTAKPSPVTAPALTADGKPRILYAGAEYCPYCAAQRWAVVAALSRFGTFSNLGQTSSSANDVYPSTATLSFHGSSYSSKYLSFTGYEMQSNQISGGSYATLDTLTPADEKTLNAYDVQKYTGAHTGSIPFIDYGGKFVSSGAAYNPQVLQGLTHEQIAADLSDPSSPVAQAVDGTANIITAYVCKLTDQKPASVCTSAGVTAVK